MDEQLRILDRQTREEATGIPIEILEARRDEISETGAALLVELARRRAGGPVNMDGLLDELSSDQVAAVARLADTSRPLDALIGPASAGKTSALDRLARAWRRDGRTVLALAPAAVAAAVVGQVVGTPSETLDAELARWERGNALPEPGTLILIDEASMATSPTLARAIETALFKWRRCGASVTSAN